MLAQHNRFFLAVLCAVASLTVHGSSQNRHEKPAWLPPVHKPSPKLDGASALGVVVQFKNAIKSKNEEQKLLAIEVMSHRGRHATVEWALWKITGQVFLEPEEFDAWWKKEGKKLAKKHRGKTKS